MKMTSMQLKRILEERLENELYRTSFNRDNDTFRIEWKETKQGIKVKLPTVIAKYNERGDEAIDELVQHIEEALKIMNEKHELTGMEKKVFPVIRSTSFPTKTNKGVNLVTKDHTAETRIFYALDLGNSYRLVDEDLLAQEGWEKSHLNEIALFNLRSLKTEYKVDTVRDNKFHFIATQDGYDASRILNEAFLEEMKLNSEGDLVIAVPHADVLIVADIINDTGYDVLAQMAMQFFAEGRVPITSLALIYEDKKLEPVFIMAENRPRMPRK